MVIDILDTVLLIVNYVSSLTIFRVLAGLVLLLCVLDLTFDFVRMK